MPVLSVAEPALKSFQGKQTAPGNVISYDEVNKAILIIQGNTIHMCPVMVDAKVNASNSCQFSYTVEGVETILGACCNADCSILAVLLSTVKLACYQLPRHGAARTSVSPQPIITHEIPKRAGSYLLNTTQVNTIQALYWTDDNHLLMITNARVEIMEIPKEHRQPKVRGLNATPSVWHYNPLTQQLLLLNLNKRNRLRVLRVTRGHIVEETHIIKLEREASNSCIVRILNFRGKSLALYCDMGNRDIIAWLLESDTSRSSRKFFTASIPVPGDYSVQLIDGLLLLHNMTTKASLIFDLPLPSQCLPSAILDLVPVSSAPVPVSGPQDCAEWSNSEGLSYHLPNLVLDQYAGRLYEVSVSIPELLALHPQQHIPLYATVFLLKRRGGLPILNEQFISWIQQKTPIPQLGSAFDFLNAAYAQKFGPAPMLLSPRRPPPFTSSSSEVSSRTDIPTSPHSSTQGDDITFCTQQGPEVAVDPTLTTTTSSTEVFPTGGIDFQRTPAENVITTDEGILAVKQEILYHEVFFKVHSLDLCPVKYFIAVVVEYFRSLEAHAIPTETLLQDFMVDLLVHSKPLSYHRLHQFIQFKVITDQVSTVEKLLRLENYYPPSFQLAIDMLSRLGEWERITDLLLERGCMVQAVELLIRFGLLQNDKVEELINRVTVCQDDHEKYTAVDLLRAWRSREDTNLETRNSTEFLSQLM